MKLIELLQLIPDKQEMQIVYDGFMVQGEEESLGCMLCEDAYKGIVTDVEAEDNVLKVWTKEE